MVCMRSHEHAIFSLGTKLTMGEKIDTRPRIKIHTLSDMVYTPFSKDRRDPKDKDSGTVESFNSPLPLLRCFSV